MRPVTTKYKPLREGQIKWPNHRGKMIRMGPPREWQQIFYFGPKNQFWPKQNRIRIEHNFWIYISSPFQSFVCSNLIAKQIADSWQLNM